jgi:hypothetical protein
MRTAPARTVRGLSETTPADETLACSVGTDGGAVVVVVGAARVRKRPFITCQCGSHAYA